jgi:predicted small integral membrane protein
MYNSKLNQSSKDKYEYFLMYYFSWMSFVINSLIPFLIILIANTSVIHSVWKSRRSVKELGIRQTRTTRDTQLAYILFVSTFLFLLFKFPLRVFLVIEPYLNYEKKYLILLDGIMRFLLYLDYGFGFYLYTFTGELFRRELRKFLHQCLCKSFRRKYFNWTHVKSRRQSDLSCSNGGIIGLHIFPPVQHANIQLIDSISSYTGGGDEGMPTPIQLSLHSLQIHKTHQCVYAKPILTNTLSTLSLPTKLSPSIGKANFFISEEKYRLVKQYNSTCFESQYKPSENLIPIVDLSDII